MVAPKGQRGRGAKGQREEGAKRAEIKEGMSDRYQSEAAVPGTAEPSPMPLCPSAPLPLGPAPLPLFFMSFTAVLLLHVLYALLNDTPPVWDMAYHQMQGFQYLAAWKSGTLWRQFADLSSYYPPLYYLQEAVILGLGSYNRFLPLLANLPGIFLLSFCIFCLAQVYADRRWAWLAGLLTLLFPLVAWTSRESLLDVSLSGWVAAAVFVLWRSRMLESHPWSLLLGVIFALGMLTKWTFPAFLVFPIGYALYASRDRKRSLLHLFDAVSIGLRRSSSGISRISSRSRSGSRSHPGTGTALENDPTAGPAGGHYPRCLSSYYLYLPLTVLFVAGLILWLRGPGSDRKVLPSFGGGWAGAACC